MSSSFDTLSDLSTDDIDMLNPSLKLMYIISQDVSHKLVSGNVRIKKLKNCMEVK